MSQTMWLAIFIDPIVLETFSGNHNTKKGEFKDDLVLYNSVISYGFAKNCSFWGKSPTWRTCQCRITSPNIIKNTRNRQFSMSTCGLKKSSWENSIGVWRKLHSLFFREKKGKLGAGMDSPFKGIVYRIYEYLLFRILNNKWSYLLDKMELDNTPAV